VPNIKSAKKRVLVIQKKNLQNRMLLSAMKTEIKKINNAIDTNNLPLADKLLPDVFSIIDKTASKGAIHPNAAANKKSAIAKRISDIKSGKLVITIKKTNEQIAAEKARAAAAVREKQKAEQAKKQAEKAVAKAEAAKTKGKDDKKKLDKKVEKPKEVKETKPKEEKPAKAEKAPKPEKPAKEPKKK